MSANRRPRKGEHQPTASDCRISMNRALPVDKDGQPIRSWETSPTYVQELEEQIKVLKKENSDLNVQLERTNDLYQQLINEGGQEKFDDRRVYLLKCQVTQLERQLVLQSEAIQSRVTVMSELDNMLIDVMEKLRSLLSESSESVVIMSRSYVKDLLRNFESLNCSMRQTVQKSTPEQLAMPLAFMNPFAKTNHGQAVTLLDVCSGSLDHINLMQIAALESRLASLYHDVNSLQSALKMVADTKFEVNAAVAETGHPVREHVRRVVSHVLQQLDDCCHELLLLSVLVPAAPWRGPVKKMPLHLHLKAAGILDRFPSSIRHKREVVKEIEAIVKAVNHTIDLLELKHSALEEELAFHKTVYDLQISYTESLFHAVSSGFQDFQQSVSSLICQPLEAITTSFLNLNSTSSDDALREFLTVMKDRSSELNEVVASLRVKTGSDSEEALSDYGRHFFKQLNRRQRQYTEERDRRVDEIQRQEAEYRETTDQLNDSVGSTAAEKRDSVSDKPKHLASVKSMKPLMKSDNSALVQGLPHVQKEVTKKHGRMKPGFDSTYRPPWDSKF